MRATAPGQRQHGREPREETLRERMRVPVLVFAVLVAGLLLNMALGYFLPFAAAGYVEIGVAGCMAATVLFFSMEVSHQSPLIRLFSLLGFFWVGILFALTAVDYLTR